MDVAGIFWFLLRWLHILAAAGWVGSALFYAIVVGPIFKGESSNEQPELTSWVEKLEGAITVEWREFLEITALILIVSGAILAFNRLSQPNIGSTYVIILGVKIALTILMAFITFRRKTSLKSGVALANRIRLSSRIVAGIGVLVILLAVHLRDVYDKSIIR